MELNIFTITYLFLRLAPFILVCFFSLSSIFNQDFKGLVYLIGLLITIFILITVGNPIMNLLPKPSVNSEESPICSNLITLGHTSLTSLPLGQAIFGYTFFYLLYLILKYQYVKSNIPTLVFFPFIIVFDIIWNITNNCITIGPLLISLIIGGGMGALWAFIIDRTKMTNLQYFNKVSGNAECSRPAKNTFKCNVYKNGKLVSSNLG